MDIVGQWWQYLRRSMASLITLIAYLCLQHSAIMRVYLMMMIVETQNPGLESLLYSIIDNLTVAVNYVWTSLNVVFVLTRDHTILSTDMHKCIGVYWVGDILCCIILQMRMTGNLSSWRCLWCACHLQNFLALCASNYYNGCVFHRNIKGFIIQTGDPTGIRRDRYTPWVKKTRH